ncbi:MAG: metal-dependent transcriptional regulator [Bacteroidales bacterium]|nr:metal-dependent transcriptional regulator [Bacteroidales bacterium]
MSVSTENFIKTVFKFEMKENADSKPGTIAKALHITNAATTDMARNLATKNLIRYEKYKELKLTDEGKAKALTILRKHRLWETFLHEVFKLSLHEIHREAELLEHQTSEFLADKISDFLNHPEFDPHGDPIPSKDGSLTNASNLIQLTDANENQDYVIKRLHNSDKDFLDFCTSHSILPGTEIRIIKQFANLKTTEITLNESKLLLHSKLADVIYIQPITNHN